MHAKIYCFSELLFLEGNLQINDRYESNGSLSLSLLFFISFNSFFVTSLVIKIFMTIIRSGVILQFLRNCSNRAIEYFKVSNENSLETNPRARNVELSVCAVEYPFRRERASFNVSRRKCRNHEDHAIGTAVRAHTNTEHLNTHSLIILHGSWYPPPVGGLEANRARVAIYKLYTDCD